MLKKIYIWLFALLYLIVGFSSFYHSVEFFGLSNETWMGVILAFAFEVGQAAVLFELLMSSEDRKRIMPWVLMGILTIVQILGNVYSSYKYILLNSVDNLRYFKEPIFIWTNLPDDQATVIVTYITSAILPITALLLTSMVTNQLNKDDNEKEIEENIEEDYTEITSDEQPEVDNKVIYNTKTNDSELIENNTDDTSEIVEEVTEPVIPEPISEIEKDYEEIEEEQISRDAEELVSGEPIVPEVNYPKIKSQFVNI